MPEDISGNPGGFDNDAFEFLTPQIVENYINASAGYIGPYSSAVYDQLELVYDVFVDNYIPAQFHYNGNGQLIAVTGGYNDFNDSRQIASENLDTQFRNQMDDYFSSNAAMNAWFEDVGISFI